MSLIAENQTVMGIRSLGERGLGTVTGHRGVRHVKDHSVRSDWSNVDISAQECALRSFCWMLFAISSRTQAAGKTS